MVKKLLIKLKNSLVMRTKTSHIFDTHFRWQLVTIIDYLLYPEFREGYRFRKFIRHNNLLIGSIFTFFTLLGIFFFLGKSTQINILHELDRNLSYKESVINSFTRILFNKDETIERLRSEMSSRDYIEFKAYRYSKIQYFDNFQSLSDKEIFLMDEECTKNEIPVSIYYRVPDRESNFRFVDNATSGAHGFFQVMPSTFQSFSKKLRLNGVHNAENNIKVGSYFLKYLFDEWKSRGFSNRKAWEYTLCEYNTGRVNMQILDNDGKVTGYFVPNYTREYISYIMKYYED